MQATWLETKLRQYQKKKTFQIAQCKFPIANLHLNYYSNIWIFFIVIFLRSTNNCMNSSHSIIMLNGTSSNKSLKSLIPWNPKMSRKYHSNKKFQINWDITSRVHLPVQGLLHLLLQLETEPSIDSTSVTC